MKKGFTLIELLAVIVILAIIALIATPIVLSIINDVKISSVKSSMNNIEKALELYYFTNKSDNEITFSCEDGICKTQNGDKLNSVIEKYKLTRR
jgi:prepilin-type N-terminal cleavage/methylation domain-containing protein